MSARGAKSAGPACCFGIDGREINGTDGREIIGADGRAMRFCEPHGGQVYVVMSYQYGMSMMGIFFFWDAHFTINGRCVRKGCVRKEKGVCQPYYPSL